MRKTAIFLLGAVLLSACGNTSPTSTNENEVIGGQVLVGFLDQAEAWDTETIVNENKEYYEQFEPEYMKESTSAEEYLKSLYADPSYPMISFWKVGTIKNGTYVDQSLVLVEAVCDGPCPPTIFRYAVDEEANQWTGLVPYSDPSMGSEALQGPGTDLEASITIPALDVPDSLNFYENDPVMLASEFGGQDPYYYDLEDQKQYFDYYEPMLGEPNDTSFSKYYSTGGCIYGETPDGILVRYSVMPTAFGFTSAKGGEYAEPNIQGDFSLLIPGSVEMTQENHTYIVTAGRCGFLGNCVTTLTAVAGEEANVVELGTLTRPENGSTVGQTVYTLTNVPELAEGATAGEVANDGNGLTAAVQMAYDSYRMGLEYKDPPETLMTLDEFMAAHEVVLLKLDNGKYVLAYDAAVAPTAECGKPVIYLYPTKAEQVSVKVNKITFSKTVPAYGNGWTVWADPSGALKNLADGKTYPYLFWEGQSSAHVALNDGWTLAKKDIATKLPVALASMGLSAKESADFMEFWLPKLQAVTAPYVEFNFEGTAAMNQVAPLTITPAPDSLLRVFMYYQGVSQAGRSMPAYTAPARHGFSVVEWGGTLY